MLTGDKIETAKCIAISTGLKSQKQSVFEITALDSIKDIEEAITKYNMLVHSHMLMVDGCTLSVICNHDSLRQMFFDVAPKAKSVCICRCSPTQKALVASNIKNITGRRIACVGDGGNDVAMI